MNKQIIKKTFFSFLLLFYLVSNNSMFAQQLCYLKENEADRAVEYLKKETDFLIYCDCLGYGDLGRKIKITNVYKKPTERPGFFAVYVEGSVVATFKIKSQQVTEYTKDEAILSESQMLDLAFVHIKGTTYENDKNEIIHDSISLGIYLGLNCDPCIDPFVYPN